MRLSMKLKLEQQVMDAMYLARILYSRLFLRFNEISIISGVNKASLQRILPRLVKRGWINVRVGPSYSEIEPMGMVGKLILVPYKNGIVPVPHESWKEFHETKARLQFEKNSTPLQEDPNDWIEIHKDEGSDSKSNNSIHSSLRWRGRNELWKDILRKQEPKREYSFYELIEYPYLLDKKRGGHLKSDENDIIAPSYNIPNGTKRFWKKASKELLGFKKRQESLIPRISLIPKQLR